MKIFLTKIKQSIKRHDIEYSITFNTNLFSYYLNINEKTFNLFFNEKKTELTFHTNFNYEYNSNYIFEKYLICPEDITNPKLFEIYLDCRKQQLIFLKQIDYVSYNNNIYYLKFKNPYCLPTTSKKGYSEKNITRKEIINNGIILKNYEILYNHIPTFIFDVKKTNKSKNLNK